MVTGLYRTTMECLANQAANQSLTHAPIGGDPAVRQGRPGGEIYAAVMLTRASPSQKSSTPAHKISNILEISNRFWA